jgi:hypothetical protein
MAGGTGREHPMPKVGSCRFPPAFYNVMACPQFSNWHVMSDCHGLQEENSPPGTLTLFHFQGGAMCVGLDHGPLCITKGESGGIVQNLPVGQASPWP